MATLLPLAIAHVGAEFYPHVFATNASITKGDAKNFGRIKRFLAFEFGLIEVLSSISLITQDLAQRGLVVGPPLDCISSESDLPNGPCHELIDLPPRINSPQVFSGLFLHAQHFPSCADYVCGASRSRLALTFTIRRLMLGMCLDNVDLA